jgi:hypothetical protein
MQESERLGYESLAREFKKDYRNNERCSVASEELADVLWKRLM